MLEFDHIAIAGETLEAARSYVEDALSTRLQPGGDHAVFHTHNALLGLEDGLYLEAIAINPSAPQPNRPRWFDLDDFAGTPRLTNWICRCDDLPGILAGIDADMGAPVALQRGDLRWQMAVPSNGKLPFDNCAPALMQWQSAVHPASRLNASGIRVRRLTVCHPKALALRDLLSDLQDDRIAIETGPAGLHAVFETPNGLREITP